MIPKDDKRRHGQENFLTGIALVHRKYRQYQKNPEWNHDHCRFCWVVFSLVDNPECLKEGYATTDDYNWICPTCFADFKDEFKWTVTEEID